MTTPLHRPVPVRSVDYVPYNSRTVAEQLTWVVEDDERRREWQTASRGPETFTFDMVEVIAGSWGRWNNLDEPLTAQLSVASAKVEWTILVQASRTIFKAVIPISHIDYIGIKLGDDANIVRLRLNQAAHFFKKAETSSGPWIPTNDFTGSNPSPLVHTLRCLNAAELVDVLFPPLGSPPFRELIGRVTSYHDILEKTISQDLTTMPVTPGGDLSTCPPLLTNLPPLPSLDAARLQLALQTTASAVESEVEVENFDPQAECGGRTPTSMWNSATPKAMEGLRAERGDSMTAFQRTSFSPHPKAGSTFGLGGQPTPSPSPSQTSCQYTPPQSTSPWKHNSDFDPNSLFLQLDPAHRSSFSLTPSYENDIRVPAFHVDLPGPGACPYYSQDSIFPSPESLPSDLPTPNSLSDSSYFGYP
ncbi:hypothetical protein P7C70_g6374, partial [Phenoliferia sp. Uapishka_3]